MSNVLREASGFVIYRRNVHDVVEYLLLQNSNGDCHYSLPIGHLRGSDGYLDAALEKIEEVTGIKEEDLDLDYTHKQLILESPTSKGNLQEAIYWLACLNDPKQPIKLTREHKAYVWLSIEEALKKVELPEIQELLREWDEHLK